MALKISILAEPDSRIIGPHQVSGALRPIKELGIQLERVFMSVTVDQEVLAAEELGLATVGQVLAHLQSDSRMVVNLLIDGQQPDLTQIVQIRQSSVLGKTLFIETVHPRQMAMDVLAGIEVQLGYAERSKSEAADLLQKNQVAKAMEKLSVCFSAWNNARESILKIGQLLRIELEQLSVRGQSLVMVLGEFADQLRHIKAALVERDFVSLSDVLLYETSQTNQRWQAVLAAVRGVISPL